MIEYAALLGAGLAGFAGSGHCVLMCGAISESLGRACGSRCGGSLLKNLSRVAGYGVMGAAVGAFGHGTMEVTQITLLRESAQIMSGLLMIVIGAILLLRRQAFAPLERAGLRFLPMLISLRNRLPKRAGWQRDVGAGLIWSLMPCGMVYAALAAAWLSVSVLQGALMMLCFGLGTLPALLGMAQLLEFTRESTKLRTAFAVMALSLGLVSLSYALGFSHHGLQNFLLEECWPKW
jgi:uncharacterized protein